MKRLIRLVLGWIFIVLGVLGLFLPILQGVLFLAIGVVLIAPESPWVQDKMERLRRRYPKMGSTLDRAQARADSLIARITPGRGE
ncbi:MAG: hypothetical protein JNM75_06605 [Rhodospirillales bacterium]|nr:hypothetical protein [Rhodospirillales bacterium]